MSKSLTSRCIRRWQVEFKPLCDSAKNPYWCKRDLRGYIREYALTTATVMTEDLAEYKAKLDFYGSVLKWSPEFSNYLDKNREIYLREAREYLNENATTEEIDAAIHDELETWDD
ncbi:hypothetical protein PT300_11825 [Enterobacteriaceae bacterium ESL0689]|nr:hypothetical protein [Enterobacteriaceae bacterium ESL0689]